MNAVNQKIFLAILFSAAVASLFFLSGGPFLLKTGDYLAIDGLLAPAGVIHVIAGLESVGQPSLQQSAAPEIDHSQGWDFDHVAYIPIVFQGRPAYFVATTGNDANPGTLERPWRTIGKAAKAAFPGMVVYIRGGVYHEAVEVSASGSQNQPIQFMAVPGESPIIDGDNRMPAYWVGLFSLWGDWIQVSGIETRNSKYDGFGLYGDHDTVNQVSVHDCQYRGILMKSNYSTVSNSHIWHNVLINENEGSRFWSTGISAGLDFDDGIADYAIIRNNEVWGNWGEGISTFNANGTVIENNIVYDNWSGNVYISDATNITLQNNFIYATGAMTMGEQVGIMLGDEQYRPASANIKILNNIVYAANRNFYWWRGAQGGGMTNVLVANNTFVNSVGVAGVKIQAGAHQNVRFVNNIVQQDGSLPVILVDADPELDFSNNLWSKTPPSAASGPGDVIGNPLFTKSGQPYSPGWFMLTGGSPAVNKALPLPESITDFFGNVRGNLPDIGACEYFPPSR